MAGDGGEGALELGDFEEEVLEDSRAVLREVHLFLIRFNLIRFNLTRFSLILFSSSHVPTFAPVLGV